MKGLGIEKTDVDHLRPAFREIFSKKGQILREVFEERILPHQEPRRKVGFTLKKLIAAFLASLGWRPKEIFTVLSSFGASHGVVRLWFIESQFKRAVKEFQDEIATGFVRRLVEFSENVRGGIWDYPDKLRVLKVFGRQEYYGEETVRRILGAIADQLNTSKSLPLLRSTQFVLDVCLSSQGQDKALSEEIDRFIAIHVLLHIWHKVRPPATVLNQSPPKASWLSDVLMDHIQELVIKSAWIPLGKLDQVLKGVAEAGDDLRFTGRIEIARGGKIVRRGRRPGGPMTLN